MSFGADEFFGRLKIRSSLKERIIIYTDFCHPSYKWMCSGTGEGRLERLRTDEVP
jgi:hypothetical protein